MKGARINSHLNTKGVTKIMDKPGSRTKSRSSKDHITRVKELGASQGSINQVTSENTQGNSAVLLEQLAASHGINLNQISGYQPSGAGPNG